MKKAVFLCCFAILFLMSLGGCRMIRIEEEPRQPLSYNLVKQDDIPRELYALIGEKKAKEFQLTFQSGEDLYLIKGYGQQMSGGYSIQVEELGISSNAIFFKTKLLGPSSLEAAGGEPSYPYIVVKTKYRKEPVQFV